MAPRKKSTKRPPVSKAAPRPTSFRPMLERLEERAAAGALTLSANPLFFIEGAMASTVFLAGLTDSGGYANGPDYSITINWGDGSARRQATPSGWATASR